MQLRPRKITPTQERWPGSAPNVTGDVSAQGPAKTDDQVRPGSSRAQEPAPPVPKRRPPFDQRHTRVTTYLENGLHGRLVALRESGNIASVTALYNAAVREYLDRYHGGNKV